MQTLIKESWAVILISDKYFRTKDIPETKVDNA